MVHANRFIFYLAEDYWSPAYPIQFKFSRATHQFVVRRAPVEVAAVVSCYLE